MAKKKEPQDLVKKWHLNRTFVANKIGISPYTFGFKMRGNHPAYNFTDADKQKLSAMLREMAEDILQNI